MTSEERFERIEESLATVAIHMANVSANVDRVSERLDRMTHRLDRAIRLGVREARNERKKRSEFDEKITQLAAAQLESEERLKRLEKSVQAFIDSLGKGGNGRQPPA